MRNLEQALEGLKAYLVEHLDEYLANYDTPEIPLGPVTADNFVTVVDLEKQKLPLIICLLPDQDEYEPTTPVNYDVTSHVTLVVLVRGDTREKLYNKALRTAVSIMQAIRADHTLGGSVADSQIESSDYYQAVEGSEDVKGTEIRLGLIYEI